MPVRDGGSLLAEAIESILDQTFRDFEFVIVDDGSRDGTPEALDRYRRTDDRVVVLTQPARGVVAALNAACGEARAPYLARMDADDLSMAYRLDRQVGVLEGSRDIGIVGGQMVCTDLSGTSTWAAEYPTEDAGIRAAMDDHSPFGHPTVTMRRDVFEASGGYRACCLHAEDYDLWLRMLERSEGANVADPVVVYRAHADQVTLRGWRQQALSTLGAVEAARLRRSTGHDPLDSVPLVTEALLLGLGVTADAIRERYVLSLVGAANLALYRSDPSEARRFLNEATGIAREGIARDLEAKLRLARARAAFRDRALVQATTAFASSLRSAGARSTFRMAKRGIRRMARSARGVVT